MRTKSDKKPENPVGNLVASVGVEPIDAMEAIFEVDDSMTEELGAFEIVPGMTVEEIKCMFFDADAMLEPPYKIWQLNSKGHRYYYRYDAEGNPEFFPSVTTILSQTLRQSPFLIEWIAKTGIEEAERYKGERAAYGSFMHAQFEELLIARTYDLDGLKNKLKMYIESKRLPSDFINYADDLKKDVLAFAQFILDYDVRPLAVEIALVHSIHKYAGMLDCPCTMLEKPGGKTRINSIVDFKSGRKGFYEESELQLGFYRDLWNVNFPEFPVKRVFNFSPNDWRKKPTYKLKEQTDSPNIKKIPALLRLAEIEDSKRDNVFTSVSGIISLNDSPELENNVLSLTLSELVKSKAPKDKPGAETAVTAEQIKEDEKEKQKLKAGRKTVATTANKPKEEPKPSERGNVSKNKNSVKKEPKKAKTDGKQKLLNDNPEI